MSVRIIGQVLDDETTSGAARMVLLVLANRAGDDGIVWESQATIHRKAQVSEAHVREVLRDLEARGLIETRKAQRGRARINVHRILLGPVDEIEYDRLPFRLIEPFSTTAAQPRQSDRDDRGSVEPTTADLSAPTRAREGKALDVSRDESERANALSRERRRDVAFDALAEETLADPAIEGSRIGAALARITKHVRIELEREGFPPTEDPQAERELVAARIRERAEAYRRRWPGVELTPNALEKNWARVARPLPDGRGMTPEQIVAAGREGRL